MQLQRFYESISITVEDDVEAPCHIDGSGPTGNYYLYICTESGHNNSAPYTLFVTYPQLTSPQSTPGPAGDRGK